MSLQIQTNPTPRNLFEAAGGEATFERIVARFYEGVATDPILRPMYPDDLAAAERRLKLFLMQFFGGPTTYNEERGHPRLRMRHAPFAVGPAAREAWMTHMTAAVAAENLPAPIHDALMDYFNHTATFLMNRDEG